MKKIYDKLILALAVLALLGGGAFYMLKSEAVTDQNSSNNFQPAENPYEPVPIPDSTTKTATWPEPGPQSSGPKWIYDVFTPPRIYIDADGNFIPEPPDDPTQTERFGIYLAKEMERKPYRIQLQGFSGDPKKPEEAVLFLFDEERQLKFFIREGQVNEEAEVEVLDFTIKREIDAAVGKAVVTAIATILDKRSGEEVVLNDDERLLSAEVPVVFLSREDPDVRIELVIDPSKPVTSFETPAGQFILQQINLEEQTVTVEKQATEDSEAVIRALSPPVIQEPKKTIKSEEAEAPSGPEDDFSFEF